MKLSLRASLSRMAYRSFLAIAAAYLMGPLLGGCGGAAHQDFVAQEQTGTTDTAYVVERTAWYEGATGSLELACRGDDVLTDVHSTFDGAYENVHVGANGWRTSIVIRHGRDMIWLRLDCQAAQ